MENTRMSYDYKFNYDIVMALDEAYAECLKTVRYPNKKKYCPHSTLPDVKLLPPPKRVLRPGSYFRCGKSLYTIESAPERNPATIYFIKHFISEKDDKIRLMRYVYRLDQIHDVSSEVKKRRSMCIYNKRTHQTYYIYYYSRPNGKKNKKVVKCISTLGFKMPNVTLAINNTTRGADSIANKFIDMVKEEVLKIVPDAVLSPVLTNSSFKGIFFNDDKYYMFYYLIIQVKVGRRLEWLKDLSYVEAINQIFENNQTLLLAWDNDDHINKKELELKDRKFQKKYLYKAVPALRKTPTKKTFTKCLMGPYYSKIAHKLLCYNQAVSAAQVTRAISSGKGPKSLHHLLTHIIRHYDCNKMSRIINYLTAPIDYLRRDGSQRIVDLYARTARNIMEISGPKSIPSFELFKDTLHMAEELNLRVRVNKFDSEQTIRVLHDRLSAFINRDNMNRNEYKPYPFVPLQVPNRTYNGYEFVQMLNVDDLVNEGAQMNHCVGSAFYVKNCIKGISVIFSLRKEGKRISTIELGADNFEIRQQYMYSDQPVTDDILLKITETWNQQLQKIHQNDSSTYKERARLAFDIKYIDMHKDEEVPAQLQGVIDSFPSLERKSEDIEDMKTELQILLEKEGRDTSPHKDVKVKIENFYEEDKPKENTKFLQELQTI